MTRRQIKEVAAFLQECHDELSSRMETPAMKAMVTSVFGIIACKLAMLKPEEGGGSGKKVEP
jgi:hypothetical protein